jgi:hypothetical protein
VLAEEGQPKPALAIVAIIQTPSRAMTFPILAGYDNSSPPMPFLSCITGVRLSIIFQSWKSTSQHRFCDGSYSLRFLESGLSTTHQTRTFPKLDPSREDLDRINCRS